KNYADPSASGAVFLRRRAVPPSGYGSLGVLLQKGDDIFAVLRVLEACKGHLGARHEGERVLQVLEQHVLGPHQTLAPGRLVGLRVGEPLDRAGLAADDVVEQGPHLVLGLRAHIVTGAELLEDLSSVLGVACLGRRGSRHEKRCRHRRRCREEPPSLTSLHRYHPSAKASGFEAGTNLAEAACVPTRPFAAAPAL